MLEEAAYPELEITNESNPKSLVNLLPASISSYLRAIPESVWLETEDELCKKGKCNEYDELLRHAFWLEYDRAIRSGNKMNPVSIFGGVVSRSTFFKEVIANTFRLAYMCTPPTDYNTRLEELLTLGLKQYREILTLPNINAKGFVDSRLVAVKQRIIEDVANRRRGQVIQRVEVQSKNLNVNVEHTTKHAAKTVEELEAEVRALEEQAKPIAQIPQTIEGVSYANEETQEHEVIDVYAEKEEL